ncbi:hypothetical protein RZS08_20185, partial [Arthrospira platensis SPKY1]|nr:hypothetical protein [Arthrospira platensis SPKY1]
MTGNKYMNKPSPSEIAYRAEISEHKHEGAINCEVVPCKTWVRVKAVYDDRWKTPMAGAKFNLWVGDKKVLSDKHLKDFEHVGRCTANACPECPAKYQKNSGSAGLTPGKPPKTAEEKKMWEELGTYCYLKCDPGPARFERSEEH